MNAPLASKPRVRPLASGAFAVTFPCGGTADIFPDGDGFFFNGKKADGTEVRHWGPFPISDAKTAIVRAWCEVAAAPAPLSTPAAEIHALALECDHAPTSFVTKTLKALLLARTGVRFSVKKGSGTAGSWIHIRAEEPAEVAALASVFGVREAGRGDVSIRPCGGARVWYVCQAAGVELPEGFTVRASDWD